MLKQNSHDFQKSDLPKNRREVFFDCVKLRFLTFLGLGAVIAIFMLPLIVITFLKDSFYANLYIQASGGAMTEEQASAAAQSGNFLFNAAAVVCYALLAVGLAGVIRIIRQIIWAEGVFFRQDFFDGVRLNGGQYVVLAIFAGFVVLLLNFAAPVDRTTAVLLAAARFSAVLVFAPITLFCAAQTAVYKNGPIKTVKNSAVLYLKSLPTTLPFVVVFCLPYLITLIPVLIVKYVVLMVFCLLVAPLMLTAWLLYACYIFDKFINKENFPELMDKGILGK